MLRCRRNPASHLGRVTIAKVFLDREDGAQEVGLEPLHLLWPVVERGVRLGHRSRGPGGGDEEKSLGGPRLHPAPQVTAVKALAARVLGRLCVAAAAAAHGDHPTGGIELAEAVEDVVQGDMDGSSTWPASHSLG